MSQPEKQRPEEDQSWTETQAEADEAKAKAKHEHGLIRLEDHRPEGYQGDCLRPMGLCELGGSCDLCWYGNPSLRRGGELEDPGK